MLEIELDEEYLEDTDLESDDVYILKTEDQEGDA